MDSQAPTLLNNEAVVQTPLYAKIRRTISDAPQGEPPGRVFVKHVWPKLEEAYGCMVQELIEYCDDQLCDKGIAAKVEGRAKSRGSIEETLKRREKHRIDNQKNEYQSLEEIFEDMHDLAGIRIVVDYPSDLNTVNQLIKEIFHQEKEPNNFPRDRQVGKLWKDKLEGPSKPLNNQEELRDAMRQAVPAPEVGQSDEDMDALVKMTPAMELNNKPTPHDETASNLKRRASFGKTLPVESLLNALSTLPEECDASESLWAKFADKIDHWGLKFKGVESAIQDQTQLIRRNQINERDQECLRDLCVINPEAHKKQIEDTKGGLLKDSYRWILDHNDFRRFRNDPESRLFWIKGDPGKGKTMLLCGIIDELKKEPSLVISYFFCQATQDQLKNATSVIRGLLWFLCINYPTLTSYVRARYDVEGRKLFEGITALVSLEDILTSVLNDPYLRGAVVIVDALDECSDESREELINLVIRLSSSSGAKWIVSSRNWPSIEQQFQAAEKIRVSLELNEASISMAVQIYVHYKVNQLTRIKGYDLMTKKAVLKALLAKANDTFLWVALVCKDLARPQVKCRHTISKLVYVPVGLNELYERMLNQIVNSDDAEICRQILATCCIAYRPVSLDELRMLVTETESFSCEELEEVIAECGSFLTVQNRVVYFVHQSAQSFLFNPACKTILPFGTRDQHRLIFRRSLDALSALKRNIYELKSLGALIDEVSRPEPDPLACLCYSSTYWVDHLEQTKDNLDLSDLGVIEGFVKEKFLYWLEALSLLKKMPEGTKAVRKLREIMVKN
ncbi:hypothetical protein G7Z17_g2135 [Cylindrodendrum hubeiense]|uniref:NACHT domain-containing protein n=1 Tax=Cylindrodendrum hubeiense TaxID=595255 RepID=A0A9P5HIC3_9HYPO|nr:hypothetical protein G7Z17_g2135 [Cylindrodendrum hubeiense]